jgi:hypothetical protein
MRAAVTGLLVLGLVACGPLGSVNLGGQGADAGAAGGGGGGGGGDVDVVPGTDAGACAAETTRAEQLPLGIYIMLDQSQSMSEAVTSGSRWTAVTGALRAFLQSPGAGVSVGIQYFGLPTGTSTDGRGGQPVSCAAADYAAPAVPIAPLPGVYAALDASLAAHGPANRTPTSAALQGALDYATAWAGANPGHAVIVILATDGEPTECDTSLAAIDAIAAAGLNGSGKVRTFVIGVGELLTNLNGIAAAGGTSQAFLVDTSADVTQQFLAALTAIRGAALGCTYRIPAPSDAGATDPTKVNVQYTPGDGGVAQIVPQVPDAAHCPATGDGWYYVDPLSPTQIVLCPATCTVVSADAHGVVDVVVGCATEMID